MKKVGVIFLLALGFIFLSFIKPVLAVTPGVERTKTETRLNSFELFWPLVAGKTMDDPVYFLKTLKENIRSMVVFGSLQKADNKLFLASKRIIEAEKLILEKKDELALKTIDAANSKLLSAEENYKKAKSGGMNNGPTQQEIKNKLANLEKFVPQLIADSESEVKDKLSLFSKNLENFTKGL